MSKYRKLTGIILKKQNYREADQIITVWTHEAGKIRILARSLKLSQSKLSYQMQDLSLVAVEVVGHKHLPTLISAQTIQGFRHIRSDLIKMAIAFYASELILKMTADEHPNTQVFDLLKDFFSYLDKSRDYGAKFYPALESFCLKLLTTLGFSIENAQTVFKIPSHLSPHLSSLNNNSFHKASNIRLSDKIANELHSTINRFIEFILERQLKSEPFLVSI